LFPGRYKDQPSAEVRTRLLEKKRYGKPESSAVKTFLPVVKKRVTSGLARETLSVKSLSLVPRLEQKLQPKLNASQELIIAGGVEESYFSPKNDRAA